MSRQSVRGRIAAGALAAVALGAAGCGGGGSAGSTGAAPAATATAPAAATVTVWFVDDAGALVPERRPAPAGTPPLEGAIAALAQGPAAPGLAPALPPGTRLLDSSVDGGLVTVDLSREFESGYPAGGSAAELAVLGPLVKTATAATGAGRARILVEGRPAAPPDSQFDLASPLSPADVAAGG
jgi:spore germination protein GerM